MTPVVLFQKVVTGHFHSLVFHFFSCGDLSVPLCVLTRLAVMQRSTTTAPRMSKPAAPLHSFHNAQTWCSGTVALVTESILLFHIRLQCLSPLRELHAHNGCKTCTVWLLTIIDKKIRRDVDGLRLRRTKTTVYHTVLEYSRSVLVRQ